MPNPSTVTQSEQEIKSVPPLFGRLVIIHDTDSDGISSAWCISQLKDQYSELLLIPQRAGENIIPEGLTENDSVFLVDRTYPWCMLLLLSQRVHDVTVIDHHKSAMNDFYRDAVASGLYELDSTAISSDMLFVQYRNLNVHIDTTQAACAMSWHYQIAHSIDPDPENSAPPWFIQYIEDRDMWWFKLADSKAINAGLHYFGNTFDHYNAMYQHCTPAFKYNRLCDMHRAYTIGCVVLQTQLNIIKGIAHGPTVQYIVHVDECWTTGMPPKRVPCDDVHTRFAVACVPFSLISDFGDYMLNCSDPDFPMINAVLVYNQVEDGYVYSIRSKQDMLWLAKQHGGGGHERASGFKSKLSPVDILRVST